MKLVLIGPTSNARSVELMSRILQIGPLFYLLARRPSTTHPPMGLQPLRSLHWVPRLASHRVKAAPYRGGKARRPMTLSTLSLLLPSNSVEFRPNPRELPEPCGLRADCVLSLLRGDQTQPPNLLWRSYRISDTALVTGEPVEAPRGGHSSKASLLNLPPSPFTMLGVRQVPNFKAKTSRSLPSNISRASVTLNVSCLDS